MKRVGDESLGKGAGECAEGRVPGVSVTRWHLWPARWWRALQARRQCVREQAILLALDDDVLRDIGIHRGDIARDYRRWAEQASNRR